MALRKLALFVILPLLALSACGGSEKFEAARETSAPPGIDCRPGAFPMQGHAAMRVHLFDAGCKSDKGIVRWEWNWGDGWADFTATKGSCYRTLTSNGSNPVHLRVTDASGRKATSMLQITLDPALNAPPIAEAHATPDSGNAPLTVQFSPVGSYDPDGSIVKWEWRFGTAFEDFTATQGIATHTYEEGEYSALLRITDDSGSVSTATTSVTVGPRPNVPPIAEANCDPTRGIAPLAVAFTAEGSRDDDGQIVKWEWDFGDGFTDFTPSAGAASQTFEMGEYDPVLRVTDDDGRSATASVHVSVQAKPNTPPIAVGNGNPEVGYAPLSVSFDAVGSNDSDGTIIKWEWDFGLGFVDYTLSQGATTKIYDLPGTYSPVLRVTDDDGDSATDIVQIWVQERPNEAPVAKANATPSSGNAPLSVSLDANGSSDSDGTITKWEWDFGAGFTDFSATQGATSRTYTDAGNYTATLRVTDDDGATATASASISVTNPPAAGWVHTYGRSQGEEGYSTVVDSSGNVYVAGKTAFDGGSGERRMLLLIKYSPQGALLWAKTLGTNGATNFVDTTINGMALDPVSGDVVVLCTSNELSSGGTDFVLAKFAPSGVTIWSRSWGGTGNETASGVAVDSSGAIYATGTSTSFGSAAECAVVKFTQSGDLSWQRLWGGSGDQNGRDVTADATGAYVLADTTQLSAGNNNAVLLRFAAAGTLQWSRGYSGAFAPSSLATDGAQLYLGGTWNGATGLMAVGVSNAGTLLWTAAWGNGSTQGYDIAVSGNTLCVCGVDDSGSFSRALVARFSTSGVFSTAGMWNSAAGPTRAYGLAFGGGFLHLAGSAPAAAGSYSSASGDNVSTSLATFNPTIATRTPAGTSTWVFGVEDPPAGVQDTGAGQSDMLAIKDFQL